VDKWFFNQGFEVLLRHIHDRCRGMDRMCQNNLRGILGVGHFDGALFGQPFGGAPLCVLLRFDLSLHGKPSERGCEQCYRARQHAAGKSDPVRRLDIIAGRDRYWKHQDDKRAEDHGQRYQPQRA
jgi:hypothetical protein